ncbi:MAG: alpha/beta hydrolase [Betaproteobacteria bacterium]|nr:alpha/beta hydrolase [Betaproteobacteria bacterium]
MPSFISLGRLLLSAMFMVALLVMWRPLHAGPIRDRIIEHRLEQQARDNEDSEHAAPVSLPSGVRLMSDVPYGKDSQQRMDIYLPQQQAQGAPVIFMVHGGAWRWGDKGASNVVQNKVARWVSEGFIFISANYRLLPKAHPLEQAQDIASAIAAAQGRAASWGGDPKKFIVMGHSAGAHLVALLTASPDMAFKLGAKPWLGTILLDSAAFDMVKIMEAKHAHLYDIAFGKDPAYWRAASPLHILSETAIPFMAVCSTRHADSCSWATEFVTEAESIKVHASVLQQDLSHEDINLQLGLEGSYTNAVESFMGGLDASVMRRLTNH